MSNETQQTTELSESQLADLASQLDATGEVTLPEVAQPADATPAADSAPTTESLEAAAASADGEATSKPEPKTEASKPGTEAAKTDDTGKQPEQSKYQKELERRERSWQKLEEEKAKLRQEREALEAERQKVTKTAAPRDEKGYSADEYEDAAKKFEASGDTVLAEKARQKAQELRQTATAKQEETRLAEFRQKWTETVAKVVDEHPDLKSADSELAKKVTSALRENPHFSMTPEGFRKAVEYVQLSDKAASVPGLQAEVETLKKEIERLNKLTSLSASGPTAKPGTKSFEDLPAKEQEAELTRMAEAADAAA